jgi:hypothetical protein
MGRRNRWTNGGHSLPRLAGLALVALGLVMPWAIGAALGQATQPADAWAAVVERLAVALATEESTEAGQLVAPGATIQTFYGDKGRDLFDVEELVREGTLIGAHAYAGLPQAFASELADDTRKSPAVPDELKDQFAPADDAAARKANRTAAEWIDRVLAPERNESVGAIVVWHPTSGGLGRPGPVFVLLVGARDPSTHAFRATRVVFGTPLKP